MLEEATVSGGNDRGAVVAMAMVLAVALAIGGCARDPETGKQRYLESGLGYMEKGKHREASIQFRNALKSLSNEAKVSIVASGIEEAYNAFNADPQMSSRFVPIEMPSWTPGRQLGTLLKTLEHRTPLRQPSGLHRPEMMQAIYVRSESTLGDIFDLVKTAAVEAIRSGKGL